MSWNQCLYEYHKKHGGHLLAGELDNGLLLLTFRDRPLMVELKDTSAGRGGTICYVQARIPVNLGKPYKLTIGAERKLSGGVNTALKMVPVLPENTVLPADFGFPEVTKKRLIRSDNHPFTKLVLGSLDLRNALAACPADRVEVRSGPGEEGLHLITVTTGAGINPFSGDGGGWYIGDVSFTASQEVKEQAIRRVETEFFPRMDRFLDLTRAVYDAVTRWPV